MLAQTNQAKRIAVVVSVVVIFHIYCLKHVERIILSLTIQKGIAFSTRHVVSGLDVKVGVNDFDVKVAQLKCVFHFVF